MASYGLLGSAFDQYKNLEFGLQLDAIEPPSAAIPISFSGTKNGVKEFSSRYDINIMENNQIGNIDKYVANGIVKKPYQLKLTISGAICCDR